MSASIIWYKYGPTQTAYSITNYTSLWNEIIWTVGYSALTKLLNRCAENTRHYTALWLQMKHCVIKHLRKCYQNLRKCYQNFYFVINNIKKTFSFIFRKSIENVLCVNQSISITLSNDVVDSQGHYAGSFAAIQKPAEITSRYLSLQIICEGLFWLTWSQSQKEVPDLNNWNMWVHIFALALVQSEGRIISIGISISLSVLFPMLLTVTSLPYFHQI